MRLILTELPLTLESDANFDAVQSAIGESAIGPGLDDLLVLPELIGFGSSRTHYEGRVVDLARSLGCYVVGGSHYGVREQERGVGRVNGGLAVSPSGALLGRYEKRHPYGGASDAQPGSPHAPFTIAGRTVRVLVCADFWYADLWLETPGADLVLVPVRASSPANDPCHVIRATAWNTRVALNRTAANPACHFPCPSRSSVAVGATRSGPTPTLVVGFDTNR